MKRLRLLESMQRAGIKPSACAFLCFLLFLQIFAQWFSLPAAALQHLT
jgi:hypothetical protein